MQWRHHGRSQFPSWTRAGHGHLGQEPVDQGAGANVRNAQLSIDVEFDHGRARQFSHAVFALRSGSGPARAEDRAAGEGRRTYSRRRGRLASTDYADSTVLTKEHSRKKAQKAQNKIRNDVAVTAKSSLCLLCLFVANSFVF